jgi:hypothetical protein
MSNIELHAADLIVGEIIPPLDHLDPVPVVAREAIAAAESATAAH